jgi:predicted DCC family thiol-disulfide oxidoreductase YuxK
MWFLFLRIFAGIHLFAIMLQRYLPFVFGKDVGYKVLCVPTRLLPISSVDATEDGKSPAQKHINRLLMIDGECVMCNATAKWVHSQNKPLAPNTDIDALAFVSLTSKEGMALRRYFTHLIGVDSIIFIEPTHQDLKNLIGKNVNPERMTEVTVTCLSRGPLRVAMYLDNFFFKCVAYICYYLIPPLIRDIVYNFIGRNRYKWFGKKENLDGCVRKGKGFLTRLYQLEHQILVEEAVKFGEEPPKEEEVAKKKKEKKASGAGTADYFSAPAKDKTNDEKKNE